MKPFLFAQGSYWIYSDSSGGHTDSMRLKEALMQTATYSGSRGVKYRKYDMTFSTFFDHQTTTITAALDGLWFDYQFGYTNGRIFYLPAAGKDTLTINYFRPGGFLPELTVNGKSYKKVRMSEIDYAKNYVSSNYDIYYFKDSVGVIRYENIRNNTLTKRVDLLRYKVNLIKN